jgi:hypothetical protein
MNLTSSEMRLIEARTCVRFVVQTSQVDYLEIINGTGCWSWVGRMGGRQELSMGTGCFWEGTPAHELIHAIGFDHMQTSVERDNYVKIMWENIRPGHEYNFKMVNPEIFSNFNTTYDMRSLMHYRRSSFSINGRDTIVPIDPSYLDIIGQRRISDGDVTRINRMYLC